MLLVAFLRITKPQVTSCAEGSLSLPDITSMKAHLIDAASQVIPNQQILVNVVSRRVRQLALGHRPLVEVPPGTREADIALTEIINKKLTFESTFDNNGKGAVVVPFPTVRSKKKAA